MMPVWAGVISNDAAMSDSSPIGMNSDVLNMNAEVARPKSGRAYFQGIGGSMEPSFLYSCNVYTKLYSLILKG